MCVDQLRQDNRSSGSSSLTVVKAETVSAAFVPRLQEEACVGHLEHPWNDASGRTSGDPQRCSRHREQRQQQ